MARVSRQCCAWVLAAGLFPSVRWLASELNPSDAASRRFIRLGSRFHWEPEWPAEEAGGAARGGGGAPE
eukprot:6637144-Lingulodinium_polyedra.AAC.1